MPISWPLSVWDEYVTYNIFFRGPCVMLHNANIPEKLPDGIRNLKSLDLKQDNGKL